MPKLEPIYYADDKDRFDLLASSRQKISRDYLEEFLRKRGILVSPLENRDRLIEYVSLLPFDYHALRELIDHTESTGRAEKLTSKKIDGEFKIDALKEHVREYVRTVNEAGDVDKVHMVPAGENKLIVQIHHTEVDYSKNKLAQRRERVSEVEIVLDEGDLTIRCPTNTTSSKISEDLTKHLGQKLGRDLKAELIDLACLGTSDERTEFFTRLIKDMDNFVLVDVIKVDVEFLAKPILATAPVADGSDDSEEDAEEFDEDAKGAAEAELLGIVRRAVLHGEALLSSAEFQNLQKRGFYLSRVVWKAQHTKEPQHIVEFEAGFEFPEQCQGFRYCLRGCYRFNNGKHTTGKRPLKDEEREQFLSLLENTALRVFRELVPPAEGDA